MRCLCLSYESVNPCTCLANNTTLPHSSRSGSTDRYRLWHSRTWGFLPSAHHYQSAYARKDYPIRIRGYLPHQSEPYVCRGGLLLRSLGNMVSPLGSLVRGSSFCSLYNTFPDTSRRARVTTKVRHPLPTVLPKSPPLVIVPTKKVLAIGRAPTAKTFLVYTTFNAYFSFSNLIVSTGVSEWFTRSLLILPLKK